VAVMISTDTESVARLYPKSIDVASEVQRGRPAPLGRRRVGASRPVSAPLAGVGNTATLLTSPIVEILRRQGHLERVRTGPADEAVTVDRGEALVVLGGLPLARSRRTPADRTRRRWCGSVFRRRCGSRRARRHPATAPRTGTDLVPGHRNPVPERGRLATRSPRVASSAPRRSSHGHRRLGAGGARCALRARRTWRRRRRRGEAQQACRGRRRQQRGPPPRPAPGGLGEPPRARRAGSRNAAARPIAQRASTSAYADRARWSPHRGDRCAEQPEGLIASHTSNG
jgi:hypothetical protein